MSFEGLQSARRKTVGLKQSQKAVERDQARKVFIARDAEERVIKKLLEASRERGVEVEFVESMEDLGRACGIKVGAAAAALIEE